MLRSWTFRSCTCTKCGCIFVSMDERCSWRCRTHKRCGHMFVGHKLCSHQEISALEHPTGSERYIRDAMICVASPHDQIFQQHCFSQDVPSNKRAMRRCTFSVLWLVRRNHSTFDFRMHAHFEGSGQTLCRRNVFLVPLRSCETTCIHTCPKITHAQLSCDHIVGSFQKQSCYGFRCVQCHD